MTTDFENLPPVTEAVDPVEDDVVIDEDPNDYMSMPAPYGRFKSGKPRKTAPGGQSRTKAARKPKNATRPDYAEGIAGLLQTAAFGLMMAGAGKNKALIADAYTVGQHTAAIAGALDALAQERPEVAAVLDKVLTVGPYGMLLGALVPLAAQIASNHGVKIPGTATADELLQEAENAAMKVAA